MKELKDILTSNISFSIEGKMATQINGLQIDSRQVVPGNLFIAIKGHVVDGHQFISKAIDQGASAIVCSEMPNDVRSDVTYIVVENPGKIAGILASNYYDNPSQKLDLIGVTGTNGKTTIATLLHRLFLQLGLSAGLLSTVENRIRDKVYPSTHTTPDPITLNKMLADMVNAGCTHCFMEVSSHAIDQHRIAGLKFKLAAFSNITHDHLDYHETFANYRDCKKKLFDSLGDDAFALTNKDDKNGMFMLQNCKATKYSFSLHAASDFRARIIEHDFNGMLLSIDNQEAWYNLVGKFNAYNLLTVYATAFILGFDPETIITALTSLSPVHGRFEYVKTASGLVGVIDYAHTPDALANVLSTINELRTKNEQLLTVVGCGGNRDHDKRPEMARISAELSDRVILTSDNPRTENPDAIIADMQTGVPAQHYKKVLKITDREEAIKTAISLAKKGDIILIAGKGHETYQEIKGERHPFDDKETFIRNAQLLN